MISLIPLLISIFCVHHGYALVVGSNTAFSRPATAAFPAAGTDNTILGFAALDNGFSLADNTTTCTYDDFFPVSGTVRLNGGTLTLLQDLVFTNSSLLNNGGVFIGNGYSVEFQKRLTDLSLPTAAPFFINTLDTKSMSAAVQSVDWSKDSNYVAAVSLNVASGASVPQELALYFFNGTTLTPTQSIDQGRNVNAVRWNGISNYLALGRIGTSAEELRIYRFTPSNGTMIVTDTRDFGSGAVTAFAWHPSGNFLVAGSASTTQELQAYSFNQISGLLTDIGGGLVNLAPNRQIMNNSLSFFSGGGNYLAAGTQSVLATPGTPELLILSFNSTTLNITTSAYVGRPVQAVDYSPTGTFVAVGLSGGTSNIRIYQHNLAPQSVTEVLTARITESKSAVSVQWDPTGSFLLVGLSSGISSAFRIYFFDKATLTLTLLNDVASTTGVTTVRWSRDGLFSARGNIGTQVIVSALAEPSLRFSDTVLVFNSDVNINGDIFFDGDCKINGRGKRLAFQSNGRFILRPDTNLILEDVELQNIQTANMRCMTDSGSITMRNSLLGLANEFTFSRGSILFQEAVCFCGAGKFNYTTALSSTIDSHATLLMSPNFTFSYDPRVAKRNLIVMTDNTSNLYLNGCSLQSTRTGLQLSTGTLLLDDHVTVSSEGRNRGEAIIFDPSLTIGVLGNASVDLFGFIKKN